MATPLMTTPLHAATSAVPPKADQKPHTVRAPFGAQRQDPYYWLRDDARKDAAMLGYLEAENGYADAVLAPLKPLREKLYGEIVGRIQQDDSSVPYRERGWWYYTRFETGQDYPVHARRRDAAGSTAASVFAATQLPAIGATTGTATAGAARDGEQVLLDVNAMARGKDYFNVGAYDVSPDNNQLAWAQDDNGRRQYTLRFRDLATGKDYPEQVTGSSGDFVWADDNASIFYIENDPETLLTVRVKRHVLGTPADQDTLVYAEKDDSFYMGLSRTRDEKYLCIDIHSTVSSEVRCALAADPKTFAVISPRKRDVEYDADHFDGRWVIRTNDGAPNFKIVTAADGATARKDWKDWIAHRDDVFIEGIELFDGFSAIAERSDALERIRLVKGGVGKAGSGEPGVDKPGTGGLDGTSDDSEYVKADEPAYSMGLDVNSEPDTPWLRYGYTSLTTPATTYEMNVLTGERRQLKRQPVIGYDPANYVTERVWATARDGVKVPVSLVYRKGFSKDGTAAMLQYAYGSYGMSMDPAFSVTNVSLLDRGMVYAIAHIRGGQEMGRKWYDQGKLFNKQNTFNDFVDVTDDLVKQGYAAKDRVAAYGGSAGGLLMGAIANMAPEKYRVILSQVPFVDVVTTMLDASIPLTTNEYDEWGNPEGKAAYDYMLSYSPYDNLEAQAYPAMFVGTGLWDSQVQYWEPAKYIAKLRTLDTGTAPVVFRVNMDAGHGGKSGRFRRYEEQSEMFAFALDQLGATTIAP